MRHLICCKVIATDVNPNFMKPDQPFMFVPKSGTWPPWGCWFDSTSPYAKDSPGYVHKLDSTDSDAVAKFVEDVKKKYPGHKIVLLSVWPDDPTCPLWFREAMNNFRKTGLIDFVAVSTFLYRKGQTPFEVDDLHDYYNKVSYFLQERDDFSLFFKDSEFLNVDEADVKHVDVEGSTRSLTTSGWLSALTNHENWKAGVKSVKFMHPGMKDFQMLDRLYVKQLRYERNYHYERNSAGFIVIAQMNELDFRFRSHCSD